MRPIGAKAGWGLVVLVASALAAPACAPRPDAPAVATGRAAARTAGPEPDRDDPATSRPAGKRRVWGRLTHVVPFCGGAVLSRAEMERMEAPTPDRRPYVIRPGGVNSDVAPLARVVADETGAFEVWLEPGTYCFAAEAKKVVAAPEPAPAPGPYSDAACLAAYARTCDVVLTVGDADLHHDVALRDPCFYGPCYHGPPPP